MKSMCNALEVSRSGYYAWKTRSESTRSKKNKLLVERIRRVHADSRRTYGSPRIHKALQNQGILCGRNRIARLMRLNGIIAQRQLRYKRTTLTKSGRVFAENLVKRQFSVGAPNKIWAGDLTCFWTGSGWLHLAVVMDLYSRRIVGWAMSHRMTEELTINAVNMALINRNPENGLVHHSDQGSQYSSQTFRNLLSRHRIQPSMSRLGNCYDNAVVESFFKTLKIELVKERRFKTREEARTMLFEYIEVFYNKKRLHSTLGYMSPTEFESKNLT